jgi:hypothetical protein
MNNNQFGKELILKSNSVIYYKQWKILPFALPLQDGRWSANCEVEEMDADGLESFQNSFPNFVSNSKFEAIHLACEDAKKQIDDILADPVE